MRAGMLAVFTMGAVLMPVVLGQLGQGIPGGVNSVVLEPGDRVVVFAVQHIQNNMGLNGNVDLVAISDAKSQVTDRITYFLRLAMTGDYVCEINIEDYWRAPGLTVQGYPHCDHVPAKRRLIGGESHARPLSQDPAVLDALDAAVCAVGQNELGGSAFKISDASGITYTTQVVAGAMYRFQNVPVVETSCHQSVCDRDALAACQSNSASKKKQCDLEVWHTVGQNGDYVVSDSSVNACVDV